MEYTDFHCHKFLNRILNTAYSSIDLAPINTAEHDQLAAHQNNAFLLETGSENCTFTVHVNI